MSTIEHTEEELTWFATGVAATLRIAEAAAIGLATIFIAPPLVILAAVVVLPLAAIAAVAGLVAAVFALPVLAFRRAHRHRSEHPHQFVHRLLARV
jgi:membrane protein implicated in regulation of membrane protease activity